MRNDWPHFHAQHLEDRRIVRALPDLPDTGIFVDVGAGEPITNSNTYHFESNGWTGLLIDPDPRRCQELREWRSSPVEQVAVASEPGRVRLNLSHWPGLSTSLDHLSAHEYAGTIDVDAVRLDTLLERHGIPSIDLLSIDTEGTELDVWASFAWQLYRPRVVIVEHATIHGPSREPQLRELFAGLPFRVLCRTPANLVLVLAATGISIDDTYRGEYPELRQAAIVDH